MYFLQKFFWDLILMNRTPIGLNEWWKVSKEFTELVELIKIKAFSHKDLLKIFFV